MKRHRWSDLEIQQLKLLHPANSAVQIAMLLGISTRAVHLKAQRLGLKKSREWIAQHSREINQCPGHGGRETQFQPGQKSWNAGTAGTGLMKRNRTSFKAGHMPHTWRPIGHTRLTKEGYLQRKVSDTRSTRNDYVGIHHLVWRMHGRQIPSGYVLIFADRNAQNFDINNLLLISRADLMRRNSIQRYGSEIANVTQLLGALNRQINRHAKKEANHA